MTQTHRSDRTTRDVRSESQTPFSEHGVHDSMKLGVYRPSTSDDKEDVYVRQALYDFDTGEWHESSDGYIVAKTSPEPSPEEVKVRFDLDPDARRTIVATPEAIEASDIDVEVSTPDMSVEEGHDYRDELGGPLVTQTERQAQRQQGVRVFPDDHDLSEEDIAFYEDNGETLLTESEWEFDFTEEFDIDFTPIADRDE